jgi:DtxR family transcriptional regulator, Mn-dependent transcriptional regulator
MPFSTHTQEDYLRALYLLSGESAAGTVKVSDLAARLGLRKPTVTQRLQSLTDKGWVTRERYAPVRLTAAGRALAENLTYKHRVIELFLCEVLKMNKADVHAEAHRLEHAVSDAVIVRMAAHLNHPTHGPHGEALPKFHSTEKAR